MEKQQSVGKGRVACLALLLVLVTWPGPAAEVSFSATVNRERVSLGETFTYTLVVSGKDLGTFNPALPVLDGFDVYSSHQTQTRQWVNGQVTQRVSFNYTLTAKRLGALVIAPASVSVGGKTYRTEPIRILVVAPGSGGATKRTSGSDLFAQAELSTHRAYVGQQVIYTVRLFRDAGLWLGRANYELPSMVGFVIEHLGSSRGREYDKVYNGRSYRVWELKLALIPGSAGEMELQPVVFSCQVQDRSTRDFFGRFGTKIRGIAVDGQKLLVLELPSAKRPEGYGGAVGQFSISSSLDQTNGYVNQPLLLRTVISGRGYLSGLRAPTATWPQNLRIYEPKKEVDQRKGPSGLAGEVVFETVIVPKTEGRLTIPAQSFGFFDPERGTYVEAISKPIRIKVAPGESRQLAAGIAKRGVEILGGGIRFIKMTLGGSIAPAGLSATNLAAFSLPALAYLCLLYLLRHQRLLRHDRAYSRRSRAAKRARICLRREFPPEQAAVLAHAVVAGYVADRLDLHQGLTSSEVVRALRGKKLPANLVEELGQLLADCDGARFAAKRPELGQLANRSEMIIGKLEKAKL